MATEKPVTITELKTFIEAVEFAADVESWIPSERQWKRIRSMIDRLIDVVPQAVQSQPHQPPVQKAPPQPFDSNNTRMAPGGLGSGTTPSMPPPSIPVGVPLATGSAQIPIRAPDIDTSHGKPYSTPFA